MNFLAHTYLAANTDDARIGALLGDFVKGNPQGLYRPEIVFEIARHRGIDCFTDQHEIVIAAKAGFPTHTRRLSGIVLDVFYDHLLAKDWHKHHPIALDVYAQSFYRALENNQHILPERLQTLLPWMKQQDWLTSYQTFAGFQLAIRRISTRLKDGTPLLQGAEYVADNYQPLAEGFAVFWEELKVFAAGFTGQQPLTAT